MGYSLLLLSTSKFEDKTCENYELESCCVKNLHNADNLNKRLAMCSTLVFNFENSIYIVFTATYNFFFRPSPPFSVPSCRKQRECAIQIIFMAKPRNVQREIASILAFRLKQQQQ